MTKEKTLSKIVKLIDGIEIWWRVDGKEGFEIEFVARPSMKGGK